MQNSDLKSNKPRIEVAAHTSSKISVAEALDKFGEGAKEDILRYAVNGEVEVGYIEFN